VFAENSVCKRTLDEIAAEHGIARRARLKRNGVLLDAPEVRTSHQPGFAVVALGALIPKKGFDTLLRGAALAQPLISEIRVEIHGDGPERQRLVSLAAQLGVRLRLPGGFSRDQLPEILDRASVVAMPSRQLADGDSDGVPTVLIEALARERPVVSTTVGSIADLVRDGETGVVVPPDDAQALAQALVRVAQDPRDSRRMAREGAALVAREFTAETACAAFLEEVEEVLRRRA
jgi:colanic acid/amylovoran biosynthesis glycosyltransferase